jgi:hypothetical protein
MSTTQPDQRYDKIIRLRLNTAEPPEFFPKFLTMMRGVRKTGLHELPGGYLAIEIGVDQNMPDDQAKELAGEFCDMLLKIDTVYEASLDYIYSEQERVIETVRWQGRDRLEDILTEVDGEVFIRADYFLHAMSFEDIGMLDKNMREANINFLNKWPQRAQAREAVPRVRAYYDRVAALREYFAAKQQRVSPDEEPAAV